mgnify:CR=1 FL=1
MGFFSKLRLSSIYENRMKQLGLNPREIHPGFHSALCSEAERYYTKAADFLQMRGIERSEHIEESFKGVADLVVVLVLGPEKYIGWDGPDRIISALARDWINYGPEGTFDLQVLQQINQARMLNIDSANAFKKERDRLRDAN